MSVLPAVLDPAQLLSVTARPGDRPGQVVVDVAGEVDDATAPLLQLCLDSRTDQPGLRELVVDLEQVTHLGADGVAALARARRRCVRGGARLVLRYAGRRRVLDLRVLGELADPVGAGRSQRARPRPRRGRTAPRPRPTSWRPRPEPPSGR